MTAPAIGIAPRSLLTDCNKYDYRNGGGAERSRTHERSRGKSLFGSYTCDLERGHRRREGRSQIHRRPGPFRRQCSRPHLSKINLLRKASSLLGNDSRASVNSGAQRLRIIGSRVDSPSLQNPSFSSGLLGNQGSPRIPPPPDGSSFTHGMTSETWLRQPVCQTSPGFPMLPPNVPSTFCAISYRCGGAPARPRAVRAPTPDC